MVKKSKRGGTWRNSVRKGASGVASGFESALTSGQQAARYTIDKGEKFGRIAGPIISSGLTNTGQKIRSLSNSASRGMGRAYNVGVPLMHEMVKTSRQIAKNSSKHMGNLYEAYQGSKLTSNRMKNAYKTYKTYEPHITAAFNRSRNIIKRIKRGAPKNNAPKNNAPNNNAPKNTEITQSIEPAPLLANNKGKTQENQIIGSLTKKYEAVLRLKDIVIKKPTISNIDKGIPVSDLMSHLKATSKKDLEYLPSNYNTKMKTTDVVVTKQPNPTPFDSLLTECQAIAGFKIDNFDDLNKEKKGNPLEIFKRLGETAKFNLIALSEAGELDGKYPEKDIMTVGITNRMGILENKINETILCGTNKAFDDNAFIYKNFDKVRDKEKKFSNTTNTLKKEVDKYPSSSYLKYIESNGINILNVHLPGNGPASFIVKPVKPVNESPANKKPVIEPVSISTEPNIIDIFLRNYLPTLNELNNVKPDLIVGDTNITCSKCKIEVNDTNRKDIMRKMLKSVNSIYNCKFLLLMSTTKVKKIRSYNFLLNQQILKSNQKETEEYDGTAIFIRVDDESISTIDKTLINDTNCGKYWTSLMLNIDNTESSENSSQTNKSAVNFLTFDTEIDECLDNNKLLNDSLFIDHTPVQISFNAIQKITNAKPTNAKNATDPTSTMWKNLVVLNAGSITNSKKNWSLNIIPNIDEIKKIDETLYYDMKTILVGPKPTNNENAITKWKDYEKFDGIEYGNKKLTTTNLNQITPLLAKAHYALSQLGCFKPAILGGGYTKKSKCKRKRKSMKNK
jgi:hypothetical protein